MTAAPAIVSFDLSPDEAERERAEDRSLNLLLRRMKVRSEVYRLGVGGEGVALDLLAQLLATAPDRPLICVARRLEEHPAQAAAIERYAANAARALIVRVGGGEARFAGRPSIREMIVADDDAATMRGVADDVARWLDEAP